MPLWLIQILVGIVASIAGQLISSISKQDQQQQKASGVRGTLQSGGDLSPRFIVGRYGTGGQLRYAGSWGNSGETPNAYYSKVIEVSCLPIRGFAGFFVNSERVTLAASKTGDLGYPVLEYRVNGVDHLWINTYTGSQIAEDPLMASKFGSDPERPYSGMVGRGCGYFVATALINRELFSGFPEYLAEVDGIALADPRGGTAQHDNPIVAAYTVLRGISHNGEWVYGPQGYSAANFRAANLASEADKCDALRPGGTAKRYRVGLDIALDEEPHIVIGEFLKACSGRWADLGGVYRFLVGAPGAPVVAITDEDIVITEQQTLEPFPGLEDLHNAVAATYPEPGEAWEMKEAPPRYRSDLEAADDGRRLVFSTEFKAVPWAVQVQDLMRSVLEDARRFRTHSQTMPPEFWEYEPLDVIAWTSARNGYVGKSFLLTMMEDLPNASQFVGLQEIDPSDYGWESEYELPWDVVPLVIARPAPQVSTGWTSAPYVVTDADDNARRPGIEVFWDGGLVDVSHVRIQVRESWGDKKVISDVTRDYDIEESDPSHAVDNPSILPNTTYEWRGIYVPFSGRTTRWTNQDVDGTDGAWGTETTPNVKLGALDIDVAFDEIAAELADDLKFLSLTLRDVQDNFERLGSLLSEQDLANYNDKLALRRELAVTADGLTASYNEIIEAAIGPGGAITQKLEVLYAAMGGSEAQVLVRYAAESAPSGVEARWGLQVSTDNGETFGQAAFLVQVQDGNSQIVLAADRTIVSNADGSEVFALFDENGFMVRDITAGRIQSTNGWSFWDLTEGDFQVAWDNS